MSTERIQSVVNTFSSLLNELVSKKIYLLEKGIDSQLIQHSQNSGDSSADFSDDDVDAIETLLASDYLKNCTLPTLFDFHKAVLLFKGSSLSKDERIETAFLMSRINFFGTDGIRGKIALGEEDSFLVNLVENNVFSPALVKASSFAYASLLMDKAILKKGDPVIFGNDGRDITTDWALKNAVIEGFSQAGCSVYDLGVVPTPVVPFEMLKRSVKAGAALTASHNPSNQNGIKFFLEGKKLLPEGELGDYVLSAYMYSASLNKQTSGSPDVHVVENVCEESLVFIQKHLPADMRDVLKGLHLVLDNANGAYAQLSSQVLNSLGCDYSTVNEEPLGSNINRNCGVAEIEGAELFRGDQYEGHIPFVKELFDRGRSMGQDTVFGLALDGDGDRGFVLLYDKESDVVHVVDGDKCGYILARYFIQNQSIDPKDYFFVSTIESDLLTASSAQNNLSLQSKIVSVGDKWIGNFSEGSMLLGLEISGHIIFPITVEDESGREKRLLTGNGLLTGLLALAAIRSLELTAQEAIRPFDPGFSKTYYVFFVDKATFYRNSTIWLEDVDFVKEEVARLINEGELPSTTTLSFEDKEDRDVLYINLLDSKGVLGCVFMRNSGTEDKNAIYVKGLPSIEDALVSLGKRIQSRHIATMKNRQKSEFRCEQIIFSLLNDYNTVSFETCKQTIDGQLTQAISEDDLFGIIYGLKKEGRITFENNQLRLSS